MVATASGLHGSSTTILRTPIYPSCNGRLGGFNLHRYNFNIWRIGVSSATSWWLGSLATPGSHHLLAHPPGPSLWRKHLRWYFFFCFFHWLASCSFGLLLLRALFSDWLSLHRLFWLDGLPLWLATYSTSLAWRASSRWTATQGPTSSSASSALLGTDSPLVLAGVGTAARPPPSGFLHIFCSASTAWHPLLLLVLTGLASGFLLGFHLLFRGEASSSASSCFFRDHTSCSRPRCRGSLLPPLFPVVPLLRQLRHLRPHRRLASLLSLAPLATTALCLLATSATRTSAR